jgi:hypothetical protein
MAPDGLAPGRAPGLGRITGGEFDIKRTAPRLRTVHCAAPIPADVTGKAGGQSGRRRGTHPSGHDAALHLCRDSLFT